MYLADPASRFTPHPLAPNSQTDCYFVRPKVEVPLRARDYAHECRGNGKLAR